MPRKWVTHSTPHCSHPWTMTSVSQLVLKMCPTALECGPELAKIVDAAIEDNGDGTVLVVHWLAAACWIDDC